jgi:hypothetical protein
MSTFFRCVGLLCTIVAICIAIPMIWRQKRTRQWAILAAVIPALYLLSMGPMAWLDFALERPSWLEVPGVYFYAPVRWMTANGPEWFADAGGRYTAWWIGGEYLGHARQAEREGPQDAREENSPMTRRLSLETLKKVPSGQLTEFIWDFYLDHFRFGPDSNLPRGFRIAKSAIIFRSEMDNGGIQQYVTNRTATPNDDPQIKKQRDSNALTEVEKDLEALHLIGATESAELLTQALALYRQYGWPFDPEMRWLDFPPEAEAICKSIDNRWFHPDGPDQSYTRDWRCGERYLREHLDDCVIK